MTVKLIRRGVVPSLKKQPTDLIGQGAVGDVGVLPTVDAGGPYSGDVGSVIALNGTVTPGDDPSPTTMWKIVSGGTGTFGNPAVIDTVFTPDDPGTYVLRLTATATNGIASDEANLTSIAVFVAPQIDAGGPYSGDEQTAIPLDGTLIPGSDPTPGITWSETTALGGTFSDPNTIDPTFTPDQDGSYELRCLVDPVDGSAVSDDAFLTADPVAPVITPPIVDAGGPYSGTEQSAIPITGTVTPGTDLNPVILWTEPSGLGGTFANAAAVNTTFTPSVDGAYTLRLSADPDDGPPVTDDAALTSDAIPAVAPTVEAGGLYEGVVSTPIALDATVVAGSDPSPTLLWTERSGFGGTFGNAALVDTTFTPDITEAYTLELTATPNDTGPVNDTALMYSEAVPTPEETNAFTITIAA